MIARRVLLVAALLGCASPPPVQTVSDECLAAARYGVDCPFSTCERVGATSTCTCSGVPVGRRVCVQLGSDAGALLLWGRCDCP